MFARASRIAFAIVLAVPATTAAQGFTYAPGTGTYRLTQNSKVTQEAMGQKQDIESTNNQIMTLTLARASKDTMTMNVVLDSIKATNSMGMPTQMIERLAGMKVLAKISPLGEFYSAQGPTEEAMPNSSQMTEAMGHLLPKLRGPLTKGATWIDTTSGGVKQGGIDMTRKTVSKYTVAGDTIVGGEKGVKLIRADSTSLSGSGNSPNGPMTMEGTMKANGAVVVSPKGTFLGSTSTEDGSIKIVLSANGMEVSVTQNATTTIEKIK